MEHLTWKLKLVILWVFQALNYFTVLYLLFIETGAFVRGAEPGSGNGIGAAIFLFIVFLMAWLSFVSKPTISRWPNIVFGFLILFLFKAPGVIGYLFGLYDEFSIGALINSLCGAIGAALIVWYGWKIPNQSKVKVT